MRTVITKAEQLCVAYHEAGHAVASCKLDYTLGRTGVTIEPSGGFLGRCGPGKYCGRRRGVSDAEREYAAKGRGHFESDAVIALAGAAAERRFQPYSVKSVKAGSRSDDNFVKDGLRFYSQHGAEEYNAYLKLLKIRAAKLVEKHWPCVEAVAAALVQRKRLSTNEVRAIVREAVPPKWISATSVKPQNRKAI